MKRTVLLSLLAVLFSSAFLFACGEQKEAEKSEIEVTSKDVKKETKEAIETAKTYTQQQKREYLQQIEAKMDDLDREIQKLQDKAQSKATELKEESRAELNQSMETLRNKKQAAAQQLAELKSASSNAWHDIKVGEDSAIDELNQAFKQARSHFE